MLRKIALDSPLCISIYDCAVRCAVWMCILTRERGRGEKSDCNHPQGILRPGSVVERRYVRFFGSFSLRHYGVHQHSVLPSGCVKKPQNFVVLIANFKLVSKPPKAAREKRITKLKVSIVTFVGMKFLHRTRQSDKVQLPEWASGTREKKNLMINVLKCSETVKICQSFTKVSGSRCTLIAGIISCWITLLPSSQ